MLIPFENLSASSRIWVYQAPEKLTAEEKTIISEALSSFCESWMTHGSPMKASFDIRHDRFIILAADETFHAASGCSIDDSVRVIKMLQEKAGIDLLDRNHVAFKITDQHIETMPIRLLKQRAGESHWNEKTLMFNNLIQTKSQLDQEWLVPAGQTWVKRYLSTETAVS